MQNVTKSLFIVLLIDRVLAAGFRSGDIYTGSDDETLIGTKEMREQVLKQLEKVAVLWLAV